MNGKQYVEELEGLQEIYKEDPRLWGGRQLKERDTHTHAIH